MQAHLPAEWDLVAFDRGELDPRATAKLEEHLGLCGECREELLEIRAVRSLIKEAQIAVRPVFSSDLLERLDPHLSEELDLVAYARGELPVERAERIGRHLERCPVCREELSGFESVGELLRTSQTPVSAGFSERLAGRLEPSVQEPTLLGRLAVWHRPLPWRVWFVPRASALGFSLSCHTFILAALTTMWFLRQPPPEPYSYQILLDPRTKAERVSPAQLEPPWEPIHEPKFQPARTVVPSHDVDLERFFGFFEFKKAPERRRPRLALVSGEWPELPKPSVLLARMEDPVLLWSHLRQRTQPGVRSRALSDYGGTGTEDAVEEALRWLSRVQDPEGRWDVARFGGLGDYDVGVTALCLLAFAARGETPATGAHRPTVDRAVQYLLANQDPSGRIGTEDGNYLYNHAIATIALLEAFAMTNDPKIELACAAALDYLRAAQNRRGGWGYRADEPEGEADPSVSVWALMALRLGRAGKFPGSALSLLRANAWLDELTNEQGEVGYRVRNRFPYGPLALTAAGLFSRQLIGWASSAQALQLAERVIASSPPHKHPSGQEQRNDFYYWYFGTLALFQQGGPAWKQWNRALRTAILACQEQQGEHRGSFAPIDRWSGHGGRVYSTAISTLSLEVYYRYPRFAAP